MVTVSEVPCHLRQSPCLLFSYPLWALKGEQTRTKTRSVSHSTAHSRRKREPPEMREDVGPSTPKGNHRKLASGCVFAKILLKITVPCDCFLCRRVSPSNASGSFCLTRSWSLTALSEGPSKTVCALGPSVPRRLPSGLAVRPQGAGALQSRVGIAPYLAHPRRVNFNFCFLGVFSLRGSQGVRPPTEGPVPGLKS